MRATIGETGFSRYISYRSGAYTSLYLLTLLLFLVSSITRIAIANAIPTIEYNHLENKSQAQNFTIDLKPNTFFDVAVTGTCNGAQLESSGFVPAVIDDKPKAEKPTQANNSLSIQGNSSSPTCTKLISDTDSVLTEIENELCLITNDKKIRINHDGTFSGYLINVRLAENKENRKAINKDFWTETKTNVRKGIEEQCKSGRETNLSKEDIKTRIKNQLRTLKTQELKNTSIFVSTTKSAWNLEFSGGVIASQLTDKLFRAIDNDDGSVSIIRNTSAEDDTRLFLGAFTHVSHYKWQNSVFGVGTPMITAGLSINNNNSIDLLLGPSIKFGSAVLNLGYHWGQVSRLPNDILSNNLGTQTTDTINSTLDMNSSTRTDSSLFLSLSFTFASQGTGPLTGRFGTSNTKE